MVHRESHCAVNEEDAVTPLIPSSPGKLRIWQGQKCWHRKDDFHETYVPSCLQSSVPHPSQCPLLLSNPEIKAAVLAMTRLSLTSTASPANDAVVLL